MKMKPFRPFATAIGYVASLVVLMSIMDSCDKKDTLVQDAGKEILSLTLNDSSGFQFEQSDLSVTIKNDSILINLPVGTDLTVLKPDITYKGASLFPANRTQQDFTKPFMYTVTAADSSTRTYAVVVTATIPIRNKIFVGSNNNKFMSLDAATGKLKWQYTSTKSFGYSTPAIKDGIVYVGGIDNYVYAFNATTGVIRWKFLTGTTGIEAPVTIDGNTLYVGCNDDIFYALDITTGKEKWRYQTGSNISTGATVINGIVYFGSSDGNEYAFNTTTGKLVWKYFTGGMIVSSGQSVTNGVVYVGSRDYNLHAIDAVTGLVKWKYYAGVSLESSSPTVVNGIVYVAAGYDVPGFTKKGSMLAIDAVKGTLVWESLPNTGFSSSPIVANGMVYISPGGGYFTALNAATGAQVWSAPIYANAESAALANGNVFMGDNTAFYAYNATTGTKVWAYTYLNSYGYSGPLVMDANGVANYAGSSGMVQ
jgi:eukaryotic-like serine/threonine-protein kinase